MGRRKAKTAIITFILTLLIVGAVAGFICWKLVSDKQEEINTLNEQKADGQVYAFKRDLRANTIITPDDITTIDIKSISKTSGMYFVADRDFVDDNGKKHTNVAWTDKDGIVHQYAIHYTAITDKYDKEYKSFIDVLKDEEIIGRMVKTNVSKNTPVLDSVLYAKDEEKPAKDLRLQEFTFLQLPPDIVEGDFVDVRIEFPTGEDYRVLGAKRVIHSKMDTEDGRGTDAIVIDMNEKEILTMASAVIEAYMQEGVRLYAIKYVDPANQAYKETIEDYIEKYNKALELALLQKDFDKIVEAYNESVSGDTAPAPLELTFEQYKDMEEADRKAIGIDFVPTKEEDLKDEDIYQFAGMRMEHVHAIREALKDPEENVDIVNYYKAMKVKSKIDIATTYPVKKEVLAVIEKNPDIINTVYQYYAELVNGDNRYDRLLQLEQEYIAAPETKDVYGSSDVKTKKEIMDEIQALLKERAKNVEDSVKTEQEQLRANRISYLNTLLGTTLEEE